MNYYIGIDAGTTNIKTAVFDDKGHKTTIISDRTPTEKVQVGSTYSYEYNTEKIFDIICSQLRRICRDTQIKDIRAIGISSMAESGIPMDEYDRPLSYAIAWFDTRSDKQASELSEKLGDKHLFHITGHFSSYKFGITKMMWFRQNFPELFRKTKHWMAVNEYILFRLCGERVCDYSIASRNLCFDIREKRWSEEVLAAADIPAEILSPTVPGGTTVGKILPEIAELTGIPADTLIVTGGHDHACAAVGTNTIRPGHTLCSMGTSEVTMMALKEPLISDESYNDQCSFYPHCSPLHYRSLSSMQGCGVSLDWAAGFLGFTGNNKYDLLAEAASHSENSSLIFYPFLRGTMFAPDSGGMFINVRDFHRQQDLAAAVFFGLCSETKFLSERISHASGQAITCIHAAGGPSKSGYFMQLKADMMGCDVVLSDESEAACQGAAVLSAIGAGDLSFENLSRMASGISKIYHPAPNAKADDYYKMYEEKRAKVIAVNE